MVADVVLFVEDNLALDSDGKDAANQSKVVRAKTQSGALLEQKQPLAKLFSRMALVCHARQAKREDEQDDSGLEHESVGWCQGRVEGQQDGLLVPPPSIIYLPLSFPSPTVMTSSVIFPSSDILEGTIAPR